MKWVEMLRTLEKRPLDYWRTFPKFESRLFKGIPDSLRGKVWSLILEKLKLAAYFPSLKTLYEQPTSYDRQIDLDINRTMRNHIHFHERFGFGQCSLFKVLVAFANYNPKVGYCQGMSTVTAFILTYFEEQVSGRPCGTQLIHRRLPFTTLYACLTGQTLTSSMPAAFPCSLRPFSSMKSCSNGSHPRLSSDS